MISNEGIFALTITDTNINLGDINPKWKKFETDYKNKSRDIISNLNLSADGRKEALQKMLLGLLKDLGLENKIGLFEGVVENEPGQLPKINWTKKTLNTNGSLNETPC